MLTDSFFEQGVIHEVCEDYARHGENYAIVSDGCSNGGGPRIDTDWGSRLICLAAEKNITLNDHLDFVYETAETAKQLAKIPGLPSQAMAATLLAMRHVGDYFQGIAIGDGFLGGRLRDGTWEIHHIEFTSGAPYYLKYRMYNEEELWSDSCGRSYVLHRYMGQLFDPQLEYPDITKLSPETWPTLEDRTKRWEEVMPSTNWDTQEWDCNAPYELFLFPVEKFEFVFVATDGFGAFFEPRRAATQKYNQPLHPLDVCRVLLDIPSFRPGFLRQQRHWNFKQDRKGTFKRRGWLAGDDVSIGGIYYA